MEGGTGGARDGCWVVGIPSGITGLLEVDLRDLQLTEVVPARWEVGDESWVGRSSISDCVSRSFCWCCCDW